MTSGETEWRQVPGFGRYHVSSLGEVRFVTKQGGVRPRVSDVGPCGFRTFTARSDLGKRSCLRPGDLVALCWFGPRPDGLVTRHLDGDPTNDALENLAYGTKEEDLADHAARARREEALGAETHCLFGHRLSDSWLNNWGERFCDPCLRVVRDLPICEGCQVPAEQNTAHPGPLRFLCVACWSSKRLEDDRRWRERHPGAAAESSRRWRAKQPPARPDRWCFCQDCGAAVRAKPTGPLPSTCETCKQDRHRLSDQAYRDRQTRPEPVRV